VPRHCTAAPIIAFALIAVTGCAKPRPVLPPTAELIVITADSAYWITSDPRGVRMRGEPILLARVDGRFREVYVADDDRSYYDAVLVGQRLFSRDLVRGDSTELFADTIIPRMAREYAGMHPQDEPLAPDEQANEHPRTSATADLRVLDVHGPYISYEYRSDVDVTAERNRTDRHAARRGVVDMRTGKEMTVSALFGREAADRATTAAAAEWESARDSILARRDETGRRAQRTLKTLAFDPKSFGLTSHEREPQVAFAVPTENPRGSVAAIALTPRAIPAPAWWHDFGDELPGGPDSARHWERHGVQLVAQLPEDADRARIVLRDANHHEWAAGTVTAPVQHVFWLDASVNAAARKALRRAFNDASMYSDEIRITRGAERRGKPMALASVRHVIPGARAHRNARRLRASL
jgi:hypothetical protein